MLTLQSLDYNPNQPDYVLTDWKLVESVFVKDQNQRMQPKVSGVLGQKRQRVVSDILVRSQLLRTRQVDQ